jgi:putative tricarboxylic transport membrane protein
MGRDARIGLGLVVLCGLVYWETLLIPSPPFVPIGPAFYPRVIVLLLAGLAVWLIVESGLAGRARGARPPARPAGHAPNYRLVAYCFSIFFAYIAALSVIGYLASTFLFVLALAWVMGPRQPRQLPRLVLLALGTTVLTFLVFEKYLYVFLPRGLLF